MNIPVHRLAELFLRGAPLMDVRAPVEFRKGAFPGAVNIPLLNDAEREAVGIAYTRRGPDAAVSLGHELVRGSSKSERLAQWAAFAREHPDGALYCFRGGMRSQIVQQWLRDEMGIAYPRILGGYKAMRRLLVDAIDRLAAANQWYLLGGLTGSGKTELLLRLRNHIDLEALTNHRGSSFGRRATPQPAQIDFENQLAIALLQVESHGNRTAVLEDEGVHIGKCAIPEPLRLAAQAAALVWLEVPREQRLQRILHDYVIAKRDEFRLQQPDTDAADALFAADLLESLKRLEKRLGGERYQRSLVAMQAALAASSRGDDQPHLRWIEILLSEYYDPMYEYQCARREKRVCFSGGPEAVFQFLTQAAAQA